MMENLPDVLLQNIFGFTADTVRMMIRCELTCKTFKRVVANDKTWEHLPGIKDWDGDGRLTTNRFKACMSLTIQNIRTEQSRGTNILVEELGGVEAWNDFVQRAAWPFMVRLLPDKASEFCFRGDTLFTLSELVQASMIRDLQKAQEISINFPTEPDMIPVVKKLHLQHGGSIYDASVIKFGKVCLEYESELNTHQDYGRCASVPPPNDGYQDASRSSRILRRLSHRAGVAILEGEAHLLAWALLNRLIALLVCPACQDLSAWGGPSPSSVLAPTSDLYDCLPGGIRNDPPPSQRMIRTPYMYGADLYYVIRFNPRGGAWRDVDVLSALEGMEFKHSRHTIVPGQIEKAAKEAFGSSSPYKVYGDLWLLPNVTDGSEEYFEAMNHAIAEAEASYNVEMEAVGDDDIEILVPRIEDDWDIANEEDEEEEENEWLAWNDDVADAEE